MFQAILAGLKDLGGGMAKGIGQSAGLPFGKDIPQTAMTKNPLTGVSSPTTLPFGTPSTWSKIGQTLGNLVTKPAPVAGSSSISPPSYGTSVTRGTPYQGGKGGKKGGQYDGLLQRLEELARRR